MDALGSAIRVDSRGNEVMRILPRVNEAINEEWISDKTRHVADGLKTQRLDRPYIRENGRLRPASWTEAFAAIAVRIAKAKPDRIGALGGSLAGVEELFALKALLASLGSTNIDMQGRGGLHPKHGRASYLFNSTVEGIEHADAIMIIGSNPRREAPVLNARIRKRWTRGGLLAGVVGPKVDLTYDYNYLGSDPAALAKFVDHKPANKDRPMLIVGAGLFGRPDGAALMALAAKAAQALGVIKDGWNGFNVLHTAAGRVGALDVCALPARDGGKTTREMLEAAKAGELDVLFLIGADEVDTQALGSTFVVYVGTHGDAGAHRADVILAGAAYVEKQVTYVNTEGRPQMTQRASFPPGEAREDWAIFRALSEAIGSTLPWNTADELRAQMYRIAPQLMRIDQLTPAPAGELADLARAEGPMSAEPFRSPVTDFYMTNPVARASKTMAECSALKNVRNLEAAE
jgi:NADH-quinone oxidoreductase subunit G